MARNTRVSVKVRRQEIPSRGVSAKEISHVAYELFERRGCVHGHDLEDWLEAERIVRQRRTTSNRQ
ncbi:MAG: DUF2934 domain-containing protein [Candidatus Omnitrophica bacterium]|nr:DUF2934 domain-containing protein [Candidatus Omnitrophota bacterium]